MKVHGLGDGTSMKIVKTSLPTLVASQMPWRKNEKKNKLLECTRRQHKSSKMRA
jgi:hypothetical protein